MANNASARKRIRKTETQTQRNRVIKSRLRTFRKKALATIADGDKSAAEAAFRSFASAADLAAKKKVIGKNTADRIKSRMAKKMAAIAA